MWAYGEIGYHTGLMSRYSEFKSRYAYKEREFFFVLCVRIYYFFCDVFFCMGLPPILPLFNKSVTINK